MLSEIRKRKIPSIKRDFSSFLLLVTDFPPIPQLLVSTLSITTTVVSVFYLIYRPAIVSRLEFIAPFFQEWHVHL